jgi:hypothetical protein
MWLIFWIDVSLEWAVETYLLRPGRWPPLALPLAFELPLDGSVDFAGNERTFCASTVVPSGWSS